MKTKQVRSTGYGLTKQFLALPDKDRVARLTDSPRIPRPVDAFLGPEGILEWTWYPELEKRIEGDMRRAPALQAIPSQLCFQFAELAHGSDEQVVVFARRWGPLYIQLRGQEELREWRRYAALAEALLRFTAERGVAGHGDDEDWRIICESTKVGSIQRNQLTPHQQTAVTALAVNTWFNDARGHRILDLVDGELQIRPNASNLFGILITQIAHVMAHTDQMAICAGCRKPFTPERPISRGARQYCRRCRKLKKPQRDASRDWRKRVHPPKVAQPKQRR
jgi:hypothetical protein